ncbi:substrate-binding domain-containing protein [Streptomyces acidiscabies]|uniref:substrate-binding domain-containing protein n=1 Tax=Streptomyces acidiscabies TaxID=42234 RepID=UPI000950B96F
MPSAGPAAAGRAEHPLTASRRALTSAARLGLRVPEDLLVVCASEDPSYAFCDPPVSTLSLAPDISIPAAVPTRLTLRASSTRDRERRPDADD